MKEERQKVLHVPQQVFSFYKLEMSLHWQSPISKHQKKMFKEKVIFQSDLFPFIAITTSTTNTILDHLLQNYET